MGGASSPPGKGLETGDGSNIVAGLQEERGDESEWGGVRKGEKSSLGVHKKGRRQHGQAEFWKGSSCAPQLWPEGGQFYIKIVSTKWS